MIELPEKFRELYPHQETAIDEALDHYRAGAKVVWLDAPTGSGKTIIAEVIRRRLETRALYVCTTKGLQDQFVGDFPYARVLKGRANYQPALAPSPELTCADCMGQSCIYCPSMSECPYVIAKGSALGAQVAVLNTAYLLAEANVPGGGAFGDGKYGRPQLVIADECDELEKSLMGHVDFATPGTREMARLGLQSPKKGAHRGTIVKWLQGEYVPTLLERAKRLRRSESLDDKRAAQRYVRSAMEAKWLAEQITPKVGEEDGDADGDGALWVRDYRDSDPGRLIFKPVVVDTYGPARLWRHAARWLCMSATIISPQEQVESLGLDLAGLPWETVSVPMTFPKEHRPIVIAGVATMTRRGMAENPNAIPDMATAIYNICRRHPGERVLIHTVSYKLAEELKIALDRVLGHRLVVTYKDAESRDRAFSWYSRTEGAVLLAPSMDRGFDFRDDLARVVVIAKVPFPNLGDRQVSARLRLPGRNGDWWYRVQTVRTIVQMTGRGVRNKDDYATTYILDREFTSNVWAKAKQLFPAWWREAVDMTFRSRELLQPVTKAG